MELRLTRAQFIAALEENNVLGQKCGKCGAINTPPTIVCKQCLSTELETTTLSGKGKIVTLTTIYTPPEGFPDQYTVCLVELAEGPRLMGNLLNVDPGVANLSLIGQPVTVTHVERAGDRYSVGKMVAVAFTLDSPS